MTGEELKKLRKKLGYSLRDFGEKVGLSHVLISYYEKGTRFISENKEK
ncbi:helix-turn-helix transcriptional regulator, partial [Carnobacterium maltaromaticum]